MSPAAWLSLESRYSQVATKIGYQRVNIESIPNHNPRVDFSFTLDVMRYEKGVNRGMGTVEDVGKSHGGKLVGGMKGTVALINFAVWRLG